MTLKAPFPWFGGKSRVAHLVWERFGNVPNYVEPFFGSGAVLLGRDDFKGTETVNDKDAYLCNFWRSIKFAPTETARWADWPVNEFDLIARHKWLVDTGARRLELLKSDPEFYDSKVAGWWVWGLCSWIGSGWCVQHRNGNQPEQLPHLGDAGMGINRKLPHLGDAGRGRLIRQYFYTLSERLRDVRIAYGDWDRVLGDSVTFKHGITAIILDPPYSSERHYVKYSADSNCSETVRTWAVENQDNPLLRIALCGYDGEHELDGWDCVSWKALGGYGSQSQGRGRDNSAKERIWFSPHCLKASAGPLFWLPETRIMSTESEGLR